MKTYLQIRLLELESANAWYLQRLEEDQKVLTELQKDKERLDAVERLGNFDIPKNCKVFEWMPGTPLRQAIDRAAVKECLFAKP